MEVLLEFEGCRRIVKLYETDGAEQITGKIHEEIKKFGDIQINEYLSQVETKSKKTGDGVFRLQKWSEKWDCYVDVDSDCIMDVKDGDRITISKSKVDVQVSFA